MRNLAIKGREHSRNECTPNETNWRDYVLKFQIETIELQKERNDLQKKVWDYSEQIGYYKGILNANGIFVNPLQKTPSVKMSIYKAEGGAK